MLLNILITLFGVAFLLLFYGWYSRTDLPRLMGFLLIFLLGTFFEPAIPGNIEYLSGNNISEYYIYGDNYSGYHWDYANPPPSCPPNNLDCVRLFHTERIENNIYSEYTNHTLGFYIMMMGLLGFILVMVDRRKEEVEN